MAKLSDRCFCWVGAHLGGHQHGGSIQISINLGKAFLRISSIRKIAVTWILAKVFAYLPSFYFQILDLIYWTVLNFYFDLFWMAWHWKPPILRIDKVKMCLLRAAFHIDEGYWLTAHHLTTHYQHCFKCPRLINFLLACTTDKTWAFIWFLELHISSEYWKKH